MTHGRRERSPKTNTPPAGASAEAPGALSMKYFSRTRKQLAPNVAEAPAGERLRGVREEASFRPGTPGILVSSARGTLAPNVPLIPIPCARGSLSSVVLSIPIPSARCSRLPCQLGCPHGRAGAPRSLSKRRGSPRERGL